jgi:hypothetical protein
MALARGVRVDGDNVVISVRGGNEAARTLCGELVLLLDQDADPIARHLASKVADHWRNECMRLRESERALVAVLRDEMDEGLRLRELGGARPDEGITAMTERIVAENAQLRAQLATFTPLRAKGVVDADDNLDCWDTNPYEICTRHVAALNEKDPAAMWRVVQLFARDEAVPGA